MDRIVLGLVTLLFAALSAVASKWSWVSGAATALVGLVGLVTTIRADGRARREEARAMRAERRAEEAERREQEAHAWDREKREAEQAEANERKAVLDWVTAKKASHVTGPFPIDVKTELDLARAAERLGWIKLKELRGSGPVLDAVGWVLV